MSEVELECVLTLRERRIGFAARPSISHHGVASGPAGSNLLNGLEC